MFVCEVPEKCYTRTKRSRSSRSDAFVSAFGAESQSNTLRSHVPVRVSMSERQREDHPTSRLVHSLLYLVIVPYFVFASYMSGFDLYS